MKDNLILDLKKLFFKIQEDKGNIHITKFNNIEKARENALSLIKGFKCENCGNCCNHSNPISISKEELEKISKYLGISHKEFKQKYVKQAKSGYFNLKNLPCIFRDEQNKTCEIYPVRPAVCRIFPFQDLIKEGVYHAYSFCNPSIIYYYLFGYLPKNIKEEELNELVQEYQKLNLEEISLENLKKEIVKLKKKFENKK